MPFNIITDSLWNKPRWRFVGKAVLGTAYVLLGGEIFLRVLAPEPILPRYVCTTTYGIRGNEPNRSYWHTTPEYHIKIRTNSKGIRADEEIPYQKSDAVKRIILLGDSFGMGYGVDLEDTFSNQMIRFLERAGIQCEIVNLSVSGHGTAEQLITLREEGLQYRPDLVLLAWQGSDIADNIRANLFRLEEDHLVRASKTYLPGVKTREFLFQFAIYRLAAEYSHLYSCVRENTAHLVKYKVLPAIRRLSSKGNPSQNSAAGSIEDAARYRERLAMALLEEIRRECNSHGANFLVFDIPRRLSRTEFKSSFPWKESGGQLPFYVFSPIELFKQQNGKKLYWEKSHGHFTPLGCRVAGQGLAKFILSKNLLQKSSNEI